MSTPRGGHCKEESIHATMNIHSPCCSSLMWTHIPTPVRESETLECCECGSTWRVSIKMHRKGRATVRYYRTNRLTGEYI